MNNFKIENLAEKNDYSYRKFNHREIHDRAIKFIELFDNKFITIRSDIKQKEMFMYDKNVGYYLPHGASYIHEQCSKNYMTSSKTFMDDFVGVIQDNTIIDRKNFTHPRYLINVKNGVFNLETNELMKHNPKYCFQGILDILYDKEATCTNWEKALKGMFKSDEDRIRTQKWFGYQFVRENKEQVAHGYFGVSGSGKSKILMILRDLLGHDNVTSFQLQEFSNPNMYALANLYEKYANINYDMSTAALKDISPFKSLTGEDAITARNPYKEPFTFVNYAKLSWACNKLPRIADEDLNTPEFRRRIMLTEVVKGHKDDDKNIYYKFRSELPGIFNWAIEGYNLYLKEKGFNYNENIVDIWKEHMDKNNQFDEHDTIQKNDNVGNRILYQLELEKQETKITSKLKEAKRIEDKELGNALETQLKKVQNILKVIKEVEIGDDE